MIDMPIFSARQQNAFFPPVPPIASFSMRSAAKGKAGPLAWGASWPAVGSGATEGPSGGVGRLLVILAKTAAVWLTPLQADEQQ